MPLSLKPNIYLVLISLGIFLFSLIGFLFPWCNTLLFFIILILVCVGSLIKLEFGLLAAILEFVLGGHGYLFSLPFFGYALSLRIALFVLLIFLFILKLLREKRGPRIFSLPIAKSYFTFLGFIILGVIIGFIKNQTKIVIFDANAYLVFLYVILFVDVFSKRIHIKRLLTTLSSGVIALCIITVALLAIYATFHYDASLSGAVTPDTTDLLSLEHTVIDENNTAIGQRIGFDEGSATLNYAHLSKTKPETYRWLRDTGTAQISYITSKFFRIFFPSHVYVLLFFFMALMVFDAKKSFKQFVFLLFLASTLIISYSRSIWLGLIAGSVLFLLLIFKSSQRKFIIVVIVLLIAITGLILIKTTDTLHVVTDRIVSIFNPTEDVAGIHRIELAKAIIERFKEAPIFGSGFGTLLSFPTIQPNGEIIFTSFYIYEWSYGDILIKIGLLGFIAYMWFLLSLIRQFFSPKCIISNPLIKGSVLGLIALAVASITTPILTHPLGISILAILTALFFASYENSNTNGHLE